MKITVNQLRRIIKEEVARTLGEARGAITINEITEQEMYDELINALVGALEDKLSDPDTQAKFLANLRGAAGVEVSPETLAREEEARKNMKDTGKKFKFLP
jgi:hypothetical protein